MRIAVVRGNGRGSGGVDRAPEDERSGEHETPRFAPPENLLALQRIVVQRSPAPGVPEMESRNRVRYAPGERRDSATSVAGIDHIDDRTFVLYGFEVNQATIKPEHAEFLKTLTGTFQLAADPPGGHVQLVEGYTDLVDTESTNEPLRRMRADAVVRHLILREHVPAGNVDTVRGAAPGSLLAENATAEGRARNRAVWIQIQPVRAPTDHVKPLHQSTKWSLQSVGSVAGGRILGGGGGLFVLKDLTNGETRTLSFGGVGLAGGVSVKGLPPRLTVSLPSPTEFETTEPHVFEDFAGPGWMDMLSFDAMFGYQFGYAHFKRIETTEHQGIYTGGPQTGSIGVSGSILFGRWTVNDR